MSKWITKAVVARAARLAAVERARPHVETVAQACGRGSEIYVAAKRLLESQPPLRAARAVPVIDLVTAYPVRLGGA